MSTNDSTDDGFSSYKDDPKSGYSPQRFYTRSHGQQGSTSARFPVISFSTETLGDVGALIAKGVFPEYRTQADFFRDAVVHLLNLRKHQMKDPEMVNRVSIYSSLAEAQRIRAKNEATRELVSIWEETLKNERDPIERRNGVEEIRRILANQTFPSQYRHELEQLVERFK